MTMPPVDNTSSERRSLRQTASEKFFLEDLHDIFATMINTLTLHPHKVYFTNIENSFTSDEATAVLENLRLAQTNRSIDPVNQKPVITSTTTTYSMSVEAATLICQQCMDARLIESASKFGSGIFERGVYALTPKGLHVLERFVTTNGMETDDLRSVFTLQPILMRMLQLDRDPGSDEIIISGQIVTSLFKRFAGRSPNYTVSSKMKESTKRDAFKEYHERYKGILLTNIIEKAPTLAFNRKSVQHRMCFGSVDALTWLTDFTSIGARDEAAVMAAHFVRFGFIVLAVEKSKNDGVTVTVRGNDHALSGEFRCANKTSYKITDVGRKILGWDTSDLELENPTTTECERTSSSSQLARNPNQRRISSADQLQRTNNDVRSHQQVLVRESNTERLNFILGNPTLLSLFREYLVQTLCEENLAFYNAVELLKRKYKTSSSAARSSRDDGRSAADIHREQLAISAWHIHAEYLAASSPSELNIDHSLRGEIAAKMNAVFGNRPRDPGHTSPGQIQEMIGLYDRIQKHVFRLMASDSIPKFMETPRFLRSKQENTDIDRALFSEQRDGIHETVSQEAAEQQARSTQYL